MKTPPDSDRLNPATLKWDFYCEGCRKSLNNIAIGSAAETVESICRDFEHCHSHDRTTLTLHYGDTIFVSKIDAQNAALIILMEALTQSSCPNLDFSTGRMDHNLLNSSFDMVVARVISGYVASSHFTEDDSEDAFIGSDTFTAYLARMRESLEVLWDRFSNECATDTLPNALTTLLSVVNCLEKDVEGRTPLVDEVLEHLQA